jgi:predicted acylesterase/phospholipase RssA
MAQAILASAAISTLVLPLRVGNRIATDGAWTRNYPLGPAYERPDVETIVAFRYLPEYPRMGTAPLRALRRRLRRFRRVPPVRALIAELEEAEARELRGEPAHYVDMITRLMRLTVLRGTALEERMADDKDASILELERLRRDVLELVPRRARAAVADRFDEATFPFGRNRMLPRITVHAGAEGIGLRARRGAEWTTEAKRSLIERGYELTDAELAAAGFGAVASPR